MNYRRNVPEIEELSLINFIRYHGPCGELFLCSKKEYPYRIFFADDTIKKYFFSKGVPEKINPGNTLLRSLMDQYMKGEAPETGNLIKNLPLTEKIKKIYLALCNVPRGKTISYADLAFIAGLPGAARFAGTCMAVNPYPLIIPCHRVIKSNGHIGAYAWGPEIKKCLLDYEKK